MQHGPVFKNRAHAGAILAAELERFRTEPELLVLGLPRGGIPVAAEVARQLNAPLDLIVVRKVGIPGHRETAMGALAIVSGRTEYIQNAQILEELRPYLGTHVFEEAAAHELVELRRREELLRSGRPPLDLSGKTVIVVDDGLATGATMRAALAAARRCMPRRLVAAVPVGPEDTCIELETIADDVVCPYVPDDFRAVGQAYEDFSEVDEEFVLHLLAQRA